MTFRQCPLRFFLFILRMKKKLNEKENCPVCEFFHAQAAAGRDLCSHEAQHRVVELADRHTVSKVHMPIVQRRRTFVYLPDRTSFYNDLLMKEDSSPKNADVMNC